MSAVWALSLSPFDKFVLLALADNANDEGACWPSIDTIASKTSLSERAVHYAVKRLADAKYIEIKKRSGNSNLFAITPASGAPVQEMHPAPDAPPGVHDVQGRGAPRAVRGAPHAPKSSRTIIEPSIEPSPRALSRACRLPENFELTPERKAVAEGEGIDASRTFATFTDYWRAASGEKARKHDWDATWRNWCRRQSDSKTQADRPRKTRYAQLTERLEASINGNG